MPPASAAGTMRAATAAAADDMQNRPAPGTETTASASLAATTTSASWSGTYPRRAELPNAVVTRPERDTQQWAGCACLVGTPRGGQHDVAGDAIQHEVEPDIPV
ncbi:hypothetical protein [Amycolatopsis sp. DSM 110486]|uniref:hypothetical protein n=1 Tax=Amycolatopsis sp. DSM 110486 TaxID=2865832 RepID=UPI001C69E7D4|nr:hypothetical protein [Amycolatopsis sp. DSM 110486]QYN21999.1 hypothetical protein K1T34_05690 [Amycolatopsis sp. DSM 110486]